MTTRWNTVIAALAYTAAMCALGAGGTVAGYAQPDAAAAPEASSSAGAGEPADATACDAQAPDAAADETPGAGTEDQAEEATPPADEATEKPDAAAADAEDKGDADKSERRQRRGGQGRCRGHRQQRCGRKTRKHERRRGGDRQGGERERRCGELRCRREGQVRRHPGPDRSDCGYGIQRAREALCPLPPGRPDAEAAKARQEFRQHSPSRADLDGARPHPSRQSRRVEALHPDRQEGNALRLLSGIRLQGGADRGRGPGHLRLDQESRSARCRRLHRAEPDRRGGHRHRDRGRSRGPARASAKRHALHHAVELLQRLRARKPTWCVTARAW